MFAPLTLSVVRDLRRGKLGVDVIALLAMAGALLLGETPAGAIIALMLSGGPRSRRSPTRAPGASSTACSQRAPRVGPPLRGRPADDAR